MTSPIIAGVAAMIGTYAAYRFSRRAKEGPGHDFRRSRAPVGTAWNGRRHLPVRSPTALPVDSGQRFFKLPSTPHPGAAGGIALPLAGGGPTTVASFVGSASLWQALVRVAGLQGLVIEVHLLPLVQDSCATRHTLATRAEIAVGCSAAFGGRIGLSVPRTQLRTLPEAVAEMNHALSA